MIRKKSLALKAGEVKKLESDEDMEGDKKNKNFALKDGEFKELESDGDMNVLVCMFKKYIRHTQKLKISIIKMKKDHPLCQYASNAEIKVT